MTKYILLATTAFLAACSTSDGEVASASNVPAASQSETAAPAAAESDIDARLASFFEEYDQMELAHSPMTKAYRGINDADYGKLDDPSDAAAIREYERDQAALAEMEAGFDMNRLDEMDQLSYRLFQAQADRSKEAFPFRRNSYIFDQMNGAQSQLPAFMINIHRVVTKADAEAYVSRLAASGPFLDVLIAQSAERADDGIMVPDWVFPYVISDAKNVISGAPFEQGADSPLYADLKKKVNALSISDAEKADLIARGGQAMKASMAPAYKKLIAEMERQQKMAVDGDGIWRLKDGAAYYAERLKYYTTTDLTAEEIHQIGLDNVARIHGEMRQIMAQVGFEGSLQDFFKHLRTSDQYFYTSREAYLADANEKLTTMEKALPGYFNTLPEAPWTIKAVEAFREKSAGKAFYQSPAPDGSRPGTYYVNLYDLKSMSKTELEALAYHEALPGHHLQRAIQTELGDLPAFRKFGGFTAYTEGWGLYTEELGKDMGFYTDPYSDFGRLGMELWRACRLVVDTGIHHKRWSREEAIQYLVDNTPNPEGDIRKAIERYIVYPGQATAYMIGKLKIMELRSKAQQQLGDKFTMGDFHDVVLKSGPVPLDILEERVDGWIAESR
ncbi:DUF885 domain-containing protein [Parasphingorhabdus sp.]|uniref:DUF885 domain-containing protein n=1 Tax=Parasphingorhabdus sp. TaxID=2709688 RepID=UPI002F93D90B